MIFRSILLRWCVPALATAGVFAAGCGDDNNKAKDDAGVPKDGAIDAKFDELPSISISPLTTDFGTVTVGQTSTPTTFTVTNAGPGATDQVQVNLSGNADYHIASNTCATLAANATCTIGITYAPSAPGASTGSLQLGVTGSSASAMLSGTGGKVGNLAVSPSTFAFTNAIVGTPGTDTDTITVTNTGGQTTGALTVQAVGSDPTQFTKATDTCNGQTVASGASCTITVKFAPTAAGNKSAGFTIIGNPGGSATASVSGLAATAAKLAIDPQAQSFGSVVLGTTSSTVAINVANIGGSPTGAITAGLGGANASSFAIVTNTCTSVLASSGNCQLTLRYTPSIAGGEVATLTVGGTPGGTVTTSLSGAGVTPGGLQIDPTTFGFGAIGVGLSSSASTFTVTNTGGTAIGPVVLNLSGGDASEFHTSADTCSGTTLQPAGKCTVAVALSPATAGTKAASLIASGGGSSVTAALTGAGTPAPQLAITPNSQNFGSVGVGTTASALSFTITNIGGAPTSVPAIALGGANANQFAQTNNCAAALAPITGTCTVAVTFKPTSIASDTATITATAATGGTVSANVFGQGANPAQLSVIPGNLSFSTTIGDPVSQTFTVQNNGSTTTGAIAIAFASGGVGASEYSQTNTCSTVPAGGTCTVTVTYTPTSLTSTATATVSATPGGSTSVALAGTALPRLELVPFDPTVKSPYDFGIQAVGADICQTYYVRNNTHSNQHVIETNTYDTDGPYPAGSWFVYDDYYDTSCKNTVLGPNDSCFDEVCFTPASVGLKHGSINYSIGSGAANQLDFAFTGTGIQTIAVTPESTADFGNVTTGKTSPKLFFRVTNVTSFGLGFIVNTPIANAINAPFNVSQGTCTAPLYPQEFCDLEVTFSPTTLGPFVSTLTVVSTASGAYRGGTAQVDVHGTGVDASALQVIPNAYDFGTVLSGSTPLDKTIVIQNPAGSQTSTNLQYTLTGASEFTLLNDGSTGDCNNGDSIPNGTSCNIRVRFAPQNEVGTVALSAQVTIQADPGAPGAGTSATLTGTAKSRITITPTSYDFGTVKLGKSASKDFTVTNTTNNTVTFDATTFTGTSTGFSTSGCTGSLTFAASCTLTVTFAPTVVATYTPTVVVALANGQGHATATLNAVSVDPSVVVWDQLDNPTADAWISVVSSLDPIYNAALADDFTVPAGGWLLTGIDVGWYQYSTPVSSWTVTVYDDNSGIPGTVRSAQSGLTTFAYGTPGSQINITEVAIKFAGVTLPAGRYWISVQAEGQPYGEYWGTRSVMGGTYGAAANFGSAYGQCGGGFQNRVSCTGYTSEPDQMFRLRAVVDGPTHVPAQAAIVKHPSVTPTAARTAVHYDLGPPRARAGR